MSFLDSLLVLEALYPHGEKKKVFLLNFVNAILMMGLLAIILIGLCNIPIFGYMIKDHTLFHLFLIYLFLNLVSLLIKKNCFYLSTISLLAILIIILLQVHLHLGMDFYIVGVIYLLIILLGIIFIHPKFSLVLYLFISSMILLIFIGQMGGYLIVDNSWKTAPPNLLSIVFLLAIHLLVIIIFCYLFQSSKLNLKKLEKMHLTKMMQIMPLLNLGKFMLGLNNEMRNQLSVISLVLQNAQDSKVAIKNLALALEAIEQIDQLSRLAYCELFTQAEPEVFDLNLEIKYVINLFKNFARKKGVTLILQASSRYQVHADRLKLDFILINLILNAVEAYDGMIRKEKNVFIKLDRKPRNLLIKVKDYGQGIEKKYLSSIFTPYFSLKNKEKALGLGLHVSQKTMLAIYGTAIKVESLVNFGSTFTLYIKKKFLLI